MTRLCDECETVAHCIKHGCIPKQQALDKMAEHAREVGLDYEQPAQRTWVGLTDDERDDLLDTYITAEGRARAIEAKLKQKNI